MLDPTLARARKVSLNAQENYLSVDAMKTNVSEPTILVTEEPLAPTFLVASIAPLVLLAASVNLI